MVDTLCTGDLVLFSNNTATGNILKIFTSSRWNHVGIVLRFKNDKLRLDAEGKLYFLETNSGSRYDEIKKCRQVGVGISEGNWVLSKYNIICIRKLKDIFRKKKIKKLICDTIDKFRGRRFPNSINPFIGVWWGIAFSENDENSEDMFCTEFAVHFYMKTVGVVYKDITGKKHITIEDLFGSTAPKDYNMFKPGHFDLEELKDNIIFEESENIIRINESDLLYVILPQCLFILLIIVMVGMLISRP